LITFVEAKIFLLLKKNLFLLMRLLRFLSFAKMVNAGKVFSSYHLSRMTGRPVIWGRPLALSVEPTTSCNLRCPECPSGLRAFSRPTGMLDKNFFRQVIDQVKQHTAYLTFYFQGEPFLNPDFLDMVKFANSRKIFTSTSTNAHFLDDATARKVVESGLQRLIISIDGLTQETYEQYRIGGRLEKVLEGTRNIIKWKKELVSATPHVVFQFLVVRHNEHEADRLLDLAQETGVNEVTLKTAQVYDYEQGNSLIPHNENYSRYKLMADGSYKIKNKLLNHCWKMWHSCVITWDGKIVPCCFDKDAKYVMGDLKQLSFREAWKSDAYKQFRSTLLKGRNDIDICRNCTEGTKVWA
jgi:radical SAM protein with 4Fe4S-binding SPASM domain